MEIKEMIKEIKREIVMRHRVYQNLIARGKMTQDESDRRIEIMECILENLNNQIHKNITMFD